MGAVDLSADLGFIRLKNPVIPASGTFGYGEEFQPFFDLDILGAFVLKGIYKKPRKGNPPPRLHETASGLLNSIGLAGPGADELKTIIKRVAAVTSTPIIVNVCGESDEEYQEVAEIFDEMEEVAMLELNISCPNVQEGGKCPAQDDKHTYRLVKRIKDNTCKPLMVKLTPNTSNIISIALSAEEAGADCLSLVNTFLGLAVDLKTRAPVFKNVFAGLSGPAIKPLALKLVWEVAKSVSIPVIGIGGIFTGKDVLEYILVGAAAVQTGTVNMVEPCASVRIIDEIEYLMKELQIKNLNEIKGTLRI
ncbi:MAG: dihydroorotate dehydrogenase [Candidatus Aminicenantes bacterium]|nr:dihydroorotate dehydrogenase [Candidatus Aminicenantes bacterium]NIM77935.1 dihydroorotate dehydrogenase [Candidatus Aminicenantes bacterium]NIN22752.1 dihydroorotate dehydrogenase [Candidatus Aminicenantes bacterium]NIN45918.1 dihydroorotate dehydrogenase [Candidatus Aminicenantes bacterium]NIN89394.1 dihydroorotate dehydrogenase [Candidatus Aminicenantes bacterium]